MSEEGCLVPSAPPRKYSTTSKEGGVIPPPLPPLLQITANGEDNQEVPFTANGEDNQEVPFTANDEDNQEVPLAPTRIMHRSDEEYLPAIKPNSLTHQAKSNKCLVYMLSSIVILSILILVMGLTILRANSPYLKLRQIYARNFRFTTTPFASLEMDMVSEVTIDNTNLFGRFKFHNSSSSVFYGTETLGISDINGGGAIEARGNKLWNVTVLVRSNNNNTSWMNNHNNSNSNFTSDIVSKLVSMRSLTNLNGEVEIMRIIHSKTTALLNCTMGLNLSSQAFQDIKCN